MADDDPVMEWDTPALATRWGWVLAAVALLGAANVGQFIISSPALMAGSPSRAAGSYLGGVLFCALAGLGIAAAVGGANHLLPALTRGLAVLLAMGSVFLVAVHAAAHVGALRPASVALLALAALGVALLTPSVRKGRSDSSPGETARAGPGSPTDSGDRIP